MTIQKTSMAKTRAHFAEALDAVAEGDVVIIERRGKPDAALVDAELIEDFLAATNPRIIKKIQQARKEKTTIAFEDVFAGRL